MNVSLTNGLDQLVHRKVTTGRYRSAREVIREALRLMEEREQMQTPSKEEICRKIAAVLASIRAGNGVDGDTLPVGCKVGWPPLAKRRG